MITIIVDGQHTPISTSLLWVIFAISSVLTVAFYLLRSFGLYAMAKKRGLAHAYLAFIPCAWIYTACKLVGKVKFFGSTFEKLALILLIAFSVCKVLELFYSFLSFYPLVDSFIKGKEIFYVISTDTKVSAEAFVPSGAVSLGSGFYGNADFVANRTLLMVLFYFNNITSLVSLVITIFLYINLFRAYAPQHYILYSVLSIMFGIFGVLVFAIRNKVAVNYSDYLRQRYNMWYANGNPYGGNVNNGAPKTPQTPFEEFAEKDEIDPGDPFANFNRNDAKKDGDDKGDSDDYFN